MPTHVYANNNEVASKAADGKSIAAFPDVCFSPPAPPVGPMPLPYPNTCEVKDTDSGTAKVFVKDKMSGMGDDSYMTKSMGDDAATKNFNKGMITGALQGKCYFGLWSMDVNMEGKGVPRHLDMVTHNHASLCGNQCNICNIMESLGTYDNTLTISPVPPLITSKNIRIGIFFDGTWQNWKVTPESQTHSNIASLFAAYECNASSIFKIYVRGVAIDGENDQKYGAAYGGGKKNGILQRLNTVTKYIISIFSKIFNATDCTVSFDVFGFSRGATAARHFVNEIVNNAIPDILYDSEQIFYSKEGTDFYLKSLQAQNESIAQMRKKIPKYNIQIKFVGLFDSVASLSNTINQSINHTANHIISDRYFQIVAWNEFRKNFPLESLGGNGYEYHMYGSHTDIGGGYGDEASSSATELFFIGSLLATKGGKITAKQGNIDKDLLELFKQHIDLYRNMIRRDKTISTDQFMTNYRNLSPHYREWISYKNHNLVLQINYALQDNNFFTSVYDSAELAINFFAVKNVDNLIQKSACYQMLSRAKTNGARFNEKVISEHISNLQQSPSSIYWEKHIHTSAVGDLYFYGDVFTVSSTRKVILNPETSHYCFPKVRQGLAADYSLGVINTSAINETMRRP